MPPQTTIYNNAHVITVDDDFCISDRFSVSEGRITGVGDDVPAIEAPEVTVVDLGGRTVLPGFIDAHAHLAIRAIGQLMEPQLRDVTSVRDVCERISAYIEANPGGALVLS